MEHGQEPHDKVVLEFTHSDVAEKGLRDFADELESEGINPNDALRMAASVMDGAGDRSGATVESVQTCMDLLRKPVSGLSGDDNADTRRDEYSESARKRHFLARKELDMGGIWLKLYDMDNVSGKEIGDRMQKLVDEKRVDPIRFSKIFHWKEKKEKEMKKKFPNDFVFELIGDVVTSIEKSEDN